MGPDAMILVFWMLIFQPAFALSSFTFIKRLFSSSSLSAIGVVSSAHLRLFVFLLAILISAYASSSPAFPILHSAHKLNKQVTIHSLDGLECKRRNSRDTWSNWQIWPWSTKWSRAKANRALPRELSGDSKPVIQQHKRRLYTWTPPDGQYQNQIDYIFATKDGEALYSQQKQDQKLTVAQIMKSLLPNSNLNWRK